mgnify:FL=1|tara:strand:+ start:325 stop:759 length:435 start_codon:yes stop_codon:yes gene_type:complete
MYKIRFHLGRGKHFMHWQIKSKLNTGDGTGAKEIVNYVDPSENQIAMMNATLKVQPSTAKKIHEGACKTVCAWIQCEAVQILPANRLKVNDHDYRIQFNPKHRPDWINSWNGNVISNDEYNLIFTNDRSLYVVDGSADCTCDDY